MTINGVPIVTQELEFQSNNTTGINVEFQDGDQYEVATPLIWNMSGTAANPIIRVSIDPLGQISLFGSKISGGPLFPLQPKSGANLSFTYNTVPWNSTGMNTIDVSQVVVGPTSMNGNGYGKNIVDNPNLSVANQEVCLGEQVVLTAGNLPNTTVVWDNGVQDGVPFVANLVGSQSYNVTATYNSSTIYTSQGLNSCYSTQEVMVTTYDLPIITTNNDLTLCYGEDLILNGQGAGPNGTYSWDNGVVDGVAFTPPVGSTNYTVIGTDENTCENSATVNVNVAPLGSMTSPPDLTSACSIFDLPPYSSLTEVTNAGGNVSIVAPGGINHSTFNLASETSDQNNCPQTITRVYEVEDNCGNILSSRQTITINDDTNPTGTAPADISVQCSSDIPTADISSVTNVNDNCTTNPTVTHVSDVSDGNTCPEVITRTYNIADDCGNNIDVVQTITINDDTNPTASNPSTISVDCLGDVPIIDPSVVIDAADNCTSSPIVDFVSESSDGNTCNGEEITRIYSITDDCGNSIERSQIIVVDVYTPSFTLSSTDPTTCDGTDGSITLSGLNPSTDYDLSYNNGQTNLVTTNNNGEYIISGLSEGSYDGFTIADGNCPTCSKTVNTIISLEDPLPPVVEAGSDVEICEEETVILNAFNPDNANLSWSNGVSDGVGFIPPLGTTSYIVTAELVNCFSFDTVEVTVNPLPIVSAGNDIQVCEDEQVTLSGTGNAVTYSWNNGVADGVAFVPSLGTTTYTVTGVSAFGCEESDDVEVTVLPKPDVDFVANVTEVCAPEEVFFMNQTIGDIAECKYTINGTTQIWGCDVSNVFSQAGCYDVNLEVELQNGCKEDTTLINYICVDDYPVAAYSVSPDELSTFKNKASFKNNSTGATSFSWDFGDAEYSNVANPSHVYNINEIESGKAVYETELIAYSDLGCADTANFDLPFFEDLIYNISNAFTPDGNKYNETFKPVFTSGFDPQEYSLKIYNRWGQIIFESRNAEIGWDGTYGVKDNSIVPVGTYVWRIDFKKSKDDERKQITGHVNLLK